ncbi:MAG TPA: enoyl-CoA hydratase/isomerase family protein, partial [Acidimicrobiia bacterium]
MAAVEILRDGPVGELSFNRPEVLNAQGEPWAHEMMAALRELEADPEVRVVLVTGKGRAFCSGLDRDDLAADRYPKGWFRIADEAMRLLETMGKPTIAGVQGWCLGGGLQVAIACDVRLAADDAVFGLGAT